MQVARIFWVIAGYICVGLAFIGAFLPIMPTTVFLLMAAYSFGKSSKRLHSWLLNHKTFGSLIRNWEETGSIAKSAKIKALLVMPLTVVISWLIGFNTIVLIIQGLVLAIVALYILTRPLPN